MGVLLNRKQKLISNEIVDWYKNSSKQVYEFTGRAGTGKSTLYLHAIDQLGIPPHRIAAMSFIGNAAIVMRTKGLFTAKTIHSWIFQPVEDYIRDQYGNPIIDQYLNKPMTKVTFQPVPMGDDIDLIIIDEGYTTPEWMRTHILNTGKKILVGGDACQLPPVGAKPAFLTDPDIPFLDEIMRQNLDSAMLYLADRAIGGLPIHNGYYGDVLVIDENDLNYNMILNSDIVLSSTNKTRDKINNLIRKDILNIKSELPILGERMICRKNNWSVELGGINLANGLNGYVSSMPDVSSFDGTTFKMNFQPRLLSDSFMNIPIDYEYLISNHEKRKILKNSKYSRGEKFEFNYASTVHSSQGNEYANGIFIDEFISREFQNNLRYTAITRFTNGLIYINKSKRYY